MQLIFFVGFHLIWPTLHIAPWYHGCMYVMFIVYIFR